MARRRKPKAEAIPDRAIVPDRAYRKALELEVAKAGLELGSDVDIYSKKAIQKIRLAAAIKQYLDDVKPPQRERKTYAAYKYALQVFQTGCAKSYLRFRDSANARTA